MSVKYRPYPACKDSGVEWLGEVPEHWDVKRLGYYFSERREKVSDKDYQPLSVTKSGVVPQLETAAKTDDGDNRKLVRSGDFVINSRSDRKGSSGLSELDGSASLINTVLQPYDPINGRFAHHLLRSYPFQEEFYRYGKGIVADLWSTNYSEMRNISLSLPDPEEQTAIATFLDRETAKLDILIAKQEKLIELLQEKRQALISHAVTKGLNPDAPTKDSGVESRGEVTESWRVIPLKYVSRIGNGSTPNRANLDYWAENGFPWLNSSVVNLTEVTQAEQFVTELALQECHLPIITPPAVLVGITGQGKTRGMATVLRFEATINQHVAYVKPVESDLFPGFLLRLMEASYGRLRMDSDWAGSTKGAITCEQLGNLSIVLPTLQEQIEIVDVIDRETAKLDSLIEKSRCSIELMREHRTALISAAVTGKIDVRAQHQAAA